MKTFVFMILCALILCSCSRYSVAGQGGCYFAKRKFNTNKNIVKIR